MKTQYLLTPHKHLKFSDSLIGLAGVVYASLLDKPKTIDEIWGELELLKSRGDWNGYISFSCLILAIDTLYAGRMVELVGNEMIVKSVDNIVNETDPTKSK